MARCLINGNKRAVNMNECRKISKGIYEYKGYRISNCGYHAPDHCVWWEAVNQSTGCADYHDTTKKGIIRMIDRDSSQDKEVFFG